MAKIPTVRQALKSGAELQYWNNYIALKIGVTTAMSVGRVVDEVGKFNTLYQKDWLDKPINDYCDALSRYILLLGPDNL